LYQRGAKGLIGLKRQFKVLDSDGSGQLDFSEFNKALSDYKLGLNSEEADLLFQIFDKSKDGLISFEEFLNALIGQLS